MSMVAGRVAEWLDEEIKPEAAKNSVPRIVKQLGLSRCGRACDGDFLFLIIRYL